jgi:hypothetical protein
VESAFLLVLVLVLLLEVVWAHASRRCSQSTVFEQESDHEHEQDSPRCGNPARRGEGRRHLLPAA